MTALVPRAGDDERLGPYERLLHCRLSVFQGGFDEQTALAVCSDSLLPPDKAGRALAVLIDRSLVRRHLGRLQVRQSELVAAGGGTSRPAPGPSQSLRNRHSTHFLQLGRLAGLRWLGPQQPRWQRLLTQEWPNLRAALDHGTAERDGSAEKLLCELWWFWISGPASPGVRPYLDRALARFPPRGDTACRLLWSSALVALTQGDLDVGTRWSAEALVRADVSGEPLDAVMARVACAWGDLQSDRVRRSPARFQAALGLAERENEQLARLLALSGLALARQSLGDFVGVSHTAQELRRASEAKGESWMLSYADYFDAVAALGNGDPKSAADLGRGALRDKDALGDALGRALTVDLLAEAAAATGDDGRAAVLLGLGNRLWHGQGRPQMGAAALLRRRRACELRVRDSLGVTAFEAAFAAGARTMTAAAGIDYAVQVPSGSDHAPARPWGDPQAEAHR